jgi:hypothetical protein
VEKVGKFTEKVVNELRLRLANLHPRADKAAEAQGETTEKATLMDVSREEGYMAEDQLQGHWQPQQHHPRQQQQ